jgi:putative spermidine/putrescine transport system substrate-binding protein
MKRITRRTFGLSIAAATVLCRPSLVRAQGDKRFDGVTLRVGTYGGSWRDHLHANIGTKFEALGGKIEYVPGNPSDNFAKIVAARGVDVPIDVMELGAADRVALARNGFLEDLPADLLPNIAKTSVNVVDGTAVPNLMVQNAFVYRVDRFSAEQLPIPETFADLEQDVYAGKLAFPDVANPQHWPAVTLLARAHGGSEADPKPGFEAAKRIRPLYYYADAVDLAQKVTMGDVIGAPWHAGMAVRLTKEAKLDIGIVHPKLGDKRGEVEFNYLGIVKGSPNKEAAAGFINIFLDTEPQAGFTAPVGVVPVNIEARKVVAQDPVAQKYMMLSEDDVANAYTMDWNSVNVEQWRADWVRVINN